MRKHRSLWLDDDLLREAEAVLGTHGPTRTVEVALENVVRRARLESLSAWELALTPHDLDELRRPRLASE